MSVSLYSGTPGSYKSYHAVQQAITWLKMGGNLITNFPLNYQKRIKKPVLGVYERVQNSDLTVDYLIDFAVSHHKPSVKAQTLVIIDEASILFNSRDFNSKERMKWINFFANHRHFNFNVILIAQQDRMIDRQIRGLIETEYKHRALRNHKLFGLILDLIFHGCFMCVEYWYPCKLKSDAMFHVFNKKIAACYDTMGLFVDSQNKMSVARQQVEEQQQKQELKIPEKRKKQKFRFFSWFKNRKGAVSIVKVHGKQKKQVAKDIGKLVAVLNAYVVANGDKAC